MQTFILVSAILFWASILICLIGLPICIRRAGTAPDTAIYENELKARRSEPLTLGRLLDGEREAARITWANDTETVLTFKDLQEIDELI